MAKRERKKTRKTAPAQEQPLQSTAEARREGARALAASIRELRRVRGWSLAVLSKRSGIATSTLSKIENSSLSLTYDRICSIAQAFGMTLSEFMAGPDASPREGPSARFVLARRGSGEKVDTPGYLYEYLCVGLRSKQIVPTLSKVKARSLKEFGPLSKHTGEEFVFVVKGAIEVHTEFYAPERLDAGEALYLDSRMGHAYLNASDGETVIVSAMYQS